MKLILGYELPFILAITVAVIKAKGAIQLGQITAYQSLFGSNIFSISGALAFASAIFCIQAKLGLGPFEVSEAEQEIMGGTLIEYSGLPLAAFKLTKAVMLYAVPLFTIVLFLGADLSPLFICAKYLMLILIAVLIKNTNPRLRIDQALRFLWRIPLALSSAAVIAALLGR
jgi:NADH-quinone oxidoreductase subunit H